MPTLQKSSPIFTNRDTRTWVQPDGPNTPFVLYTCQAITEWSRDTEEPVYVKCKSPNEYNESDIKRTIEGADQEPTFSVAAYTPQDEEFLTDLECPVDFQVFYGACEGPSSPTGYAKVRHFYRSRRTNIGEGNVDYIGEEEGAGIEMSAAFSAEDAVVILQASVANSRVGITETQNFNGIDILNRGRCEGDCGAEIRRCYWGVVGADASYGAATANIWYTQDGGLTWTVAATDPFSENSAHVGDVLILQGETTPRILAFRGNVSGSYAARCSISDDWGATWSEVDMGGNLNGSYINGAYAYSDGLLFAVGNNGSIWYSTDRGASWTWITTTTTGVTVDLYDIHSPDGNTIFAVGADNTVIRSTDGADSWASMTGPAGTATCDLFTVQAPTTYRVWAGGEIDASEDVLWYSTDGGTTWSDRDFTGSTTASGRVRRIRLPPRAPIQHMVMIHGTGASNDRFFRTLDGGATWERMNAVVNAGLNDLAVCDINTALAAGNVSGSFGMIQRMST